MEMTTSRTDPDVHTSSWNGKRWFTFQKIQG